MNFFQDEFVVQLRVIVMAFMGTITIIDFRVDFDEYFQYVFANPPWTLYINMFISIVKTWITLMQLQMMYHLNEEEEEVWKTLFGHKFNNRSP